MEHRHYPLPVLTAPIAAGTMFLIRETKMTVAAPDVRMLEGLERLAREIPPPRFLAKGECVLTQGPTNVAKTIWSLPPGDWAVACAHTLVAEISRTGWLCWILQCRLEIPLVAVLIESQAQHAPELPGTRLEIQCVEVRVAAGIGGCCVGCDDWI